MAPPTSVAPAGPGDRRRPAGGCGVGGPVDRGFESWFGIVASLDMPPYVYFRDRKPVVIPTEFLQRKHRFGVRPGLADPDLTSSAVLGDLASESVKLIKTHDPEEPLFLYLALNAPHSPVAPSTKWQGLSAVNEHADFRMEVDHTVGRVLESLESAQARGATILAEVNGFATVSDPSNIGSKQTRTRPHSFDNLMRSTRRSTAWSPSS